MEIHELCTSELASAIRARDLLAREAARAYLERIAAYDRDVGAYLWVDADGALAQADDIDRRLCAGDDPGPLAGVPVAIKDNLAWAGKPCTCGSRMLEGFRPPYSARAVERLQAAGAVILGKTNLDEFAMGSSTENSALGCTRNPRDPSRVPGGSSGGSAAAVAAGLASAALGSDTGGSIRQPASFCGVAGMKPSYGLVSRYGLVAFGSSLDQIGPFARSARDVALVLAAIAGPDSRDATCRRSPAPDLLSGIDQGLSGLRVGVVREHLDSPGLAPDVRQSVQAAVEAAAAGGAKIIDISLPMQDYATPAYYIIATAEASSNLARYDGAHYGHSSSDAGDIFTLFSRTRKAGFGAEVKRRIMLGTYVLSAGYYDAYYLRALRVRTRIAQDFAAAFQRVDLIVNPTSPTTAFGLGDKTGDPLTMYLSDIYTISANLAALPAVSVPCGLDSGGLPVGLQITAPRWQDGLALRAAQALGQVLAPADCPAPAES